MLCRIEGGWGQVPLFRKLIAINVGWEQNKVCDKRAQYTWKVPSEQAKCRSEGLGGAEEERFSNLLGTKGNSFGQIREQRLQSVQASPPWP